jgi:putative phosphoesterase
MKILVISDIHEHFDNLSRVLDKIPDLWVEKIFCLWDLINWWIWKMLVSTSVPVHIIWWNNDGNKTWVMRACFNSKNWSIVSDNEFDAIEIDWRRIFLTHYPIIAQSVAKSGDYDVVMYGHDHLKSMRMVWDCLLFNPGEICASRTKTCTYGVYDTTTNTAELFELDGATWVKNLVNI